MHYIAFFLLVNPTEYMSIMCIAGWYIYVCDLHFWRYQNWYSKPRLLAINTVSDSTDNDPYMSKFLAAKLRKVQYELAVSVGSWLTYGTIGCFLGSPLRSRVAISWCCVLNFCCRCRYRLHSSTSWLCLNSLAVERPLIYSLCRAVFSRFCQFSSLRLRNKKLSPSWDGCPLSCHWLFSFINIRMY